MNLTRRVRALERAVNPDGCCEGCSFEPAAPVKLRLSFAEAPVDGPDVCPECGRPLLIRISIERVLAGEGNLQTRRAAEGKGG